MPQDELTGKIISCAYQVHNTLGPGFMEKVYENALFCELLEQNLRVRQQEPIKVYYRDNLVGDFLADLFVEDHIIIELKACVSLAKEHEVQLVNYLKATKTQIGLLVNFGPSVQIRRKIVTSIDNN